MTSFTRNWTDAYIGLPPNTEDARKGASRVRDLKRDLQERMRVDHSWQGDDKDGQHILITLIPQSADPDTLPAGRLYAKLIGTPPAQDCELIYKSQGGVVTQLTSSGSPGGSFILPGTIIALGNAVQNMAPAYLTCDGSAVGRLTYPQLFNAIGIGWGPGNGTTTFNIPDLRGRTLIAAGTGSGLTNRVVGTPYGEENHVLTIAEIPAHGHFLITQSTAGAPGTNGYQTINVPNTTAGTELTGGGAGHNNMQPSMGIHYVIKT